MNIRNLSGPQTGARPIELTARHREILALIVRGLTSRKIAAELGISRRTVEVHRTNMMRRLGARSLEHLLRDAVLQRWVPADVPQPKDEVPAPAMESDPIP